MHQAWLITEVKDSVDVCVVHHLVNGSSLILELTLRYQSKYRRWIKNVSPDIADKFLRYKDAEIRCRAEKFLRDNGVEFEWR